jgi:ABC-type lipoprotein release transport system permease subunit
LFDRSGIEYAGMPSPGFPTKTNPMFKSYWTIAWRTLVRNRIYTFVNVAGLALGICACLVIWVVVHYEFSFDRDRPGRARIYRINSYEQFLKNEPEHLTTVVVASLPDAVQKGVPGIEVVARFHELSQDSAIVVGGKLRSGYAVKSIVAGPEYFRVMLYQWLAGDPKTAMELPFGVVLTESRARIYFGDGPLNGFIGRELVYQDSLPVHVTGIVADYPGNTDFPYTDFISWSTVDHSFLLQTLQLDPTVNNKQRPVLGMLVKLAPATDPVRTASLVSDVFKGLPTWIFTRVELQPLSQVHFTQTWGAETTLTTRQLSTLYSLLAIAFFILALAIINYVNLATAQSLSREKEVTIRKVMGSSRASLIAQLLIETALLTGVAALAAVVFVRPILGLFRDFLPKHLEFLPLAPANLLFLLGIMVTVTLLAGLYPARMLSAHSPVASLGGGNAYRGSGKWWLRRGLIVFQFAVALLFIIGTMTMGRQIGFMTHKELGFRTDAIVDFGTADHRDSATISRAKLLEHAIAGLPGVAAAAREDMPPAGDDRGIANIRYRRLGDVRIHAELIKGDENYIPLYGMRLMAGRNLFPSDTLKEVVINESLSRVLGFRTPEQAVGAEITLWNKEVPIVGVVTDFHKYSYREPIQPLIIADLPCTDIAVRLDTKGETAAEAHAILSRIGRKWKEFFPHDPFEYGFFDDEIAQMYQREMSMQWLMNIAMGVTIFISCIGLFGLMLFTTERRTREIGIRKVMGARVSDILTLLGKDFVRLVGIALVIATAGGWWLMNRWLENYAYRVKIGPDIFLLAGGALLVVTLVTVWLQSLRAALVNPVKSLRSE